MVILNDVSRLRETYRKTKKLN